VNLIETGSTYECHFHILQAMLLGPCCVNYPLSCKQLNIRVSYCLAGASVLTEELVMCWQPLNL
jgi:hypothetical protein